MPQMKNQHQNIFDVSNTTVLFQEEEVLFNLFVMLIVVHVLNMEIILQHDSDTFNWAYPLFSKRKLENIIIINSSINRFLLL